MNSKPDNEQDLSFRNMEGSTKDDSKWIKHQRKSDWFEQIKTTGLDIDMQGADEGFPHPKEAWIFIIKRLTENQAEWKEKVILRHILKKLQNSKV